MTTRRAAIPAVLCAGASALLLNLSYFPLDWGWLAWCALAPWLVLVRADLRNRDRYLLAWLSALAFFLPALRWMRVAHDVMFYSWLGLSLACSWFAPLALWLIRRLDRNGWPLTLSVPVVWTALEFLRTHIVGGFPWYLLGQSQHGWLAVIQIADLAGVPGVTFLVAAVNGVLADWLFGRPEVQSRLHLAVRSPRVRSQFVAIAASLVLVLGYGFWRLNQEPFTDGPIVALLQTDLEQGVRNDRNVESIDVQNQKLMREAVARQPKPDLIVWAETTYPAMWKVAHEPPMDNYEYLAWAADIPEMAAGLRAWAASAQCPLLLGLNVETFADERTANAARARFDDAVAKLRAANLPPDEFKAAERRAYEALFADVLERFNSSLLVGANGAVIDRYDKTHLVPFGEYVPLYKSLPFLSALAPYAGDALNMLTPGDRWTRFSFATPKRPYSFGSLICYESAYAHLARKYMTGDGKPVDFLVNQSNDGWFRCTHEHEQHLAVSRFRAIECRRSLLRAVNMGISTIIDGNGRIRALPGPTWDASKGVMAVVSGTVPIDDRTSFYARTGDLLPWVCWGAIVYAVVRPRRSGRP